MTLKEMNNPFEGYDPRTGTTEVERENEQLAKKAAIIVGLKFIDGVDLDEAIAEVQTMADFMYLPAKYWQEIKEKTIALAPSEFTDRELSRMPDQDIDEINSAKAHIVERLTQLKQR